MQALAKLEPMPPFVTSEFILKLLLALGGKATLSEIKQYVKANYSGWTPNTMMYIGTQLGSLRRSGYVGNTKMDIRKRNSTPTFYITDEARAIIEASR